MSVGFVGLGNIGGAMAQRLLEPDRGLMVHDVRAEAMTPFVEKGATAGTLAEVAACDVISVVVLTDAQVREVVGELLSHARAGAVIAVHSTIDPGTAEELAEAGSHIGVHVLDAPVSGGAVGAAQGSLAVMVGGDRAGYEAAKPVFAAWAGLVLHVGPAGAGTRCKLARNLLTFVGFAAAAEATRLAEKGGVDLAKLAAVVRHSDAITGGPGAIMLRPTTAQLPADDGLRPIFEHTLELGEKDLAAALALGADLGVALPFATLALTSLADGLGVPHHEAS